MWPLGLLFQFYGDGYVQFILGEEGTQIDTLYLDLDPEIVSSADFL
jgi:hypothetical protein